jgi:hypothetical protein
LHSQYVEDKSKSGCDTISFTDNCDIFASFHEDGFNRIIGHVMSQRPSLFNYATADVANNQELLCSAIKPHPIVIVRKNPLVTIVDPLPIPGTNYGVNFAAQIVEVKIDFHPGNQFELPSELNPPLAVQKLGIKLRICAGIGCPPKDIIDKYIPPPPEPDKERPPRDEQTPLIPLPVRQLNCFCLDAYATGGIRIATYYGKPYLEPFLDGFEIVDIKPDGMEESIECYAILVLRLSVLPGLRILLDNMILNLTQGATDFFPTPINILISPMPASPALPNNPAIEDDQLKAFIKAEVI